MTTASDGEISAELRVRVSSAGALFFGDTNPHALAHMLVLLHKSRIMGLVGGWFLPLRTY